MAFCWHCGSDDHSDEELVQCMMVMDMDAYLQLEELGLLDESPEQGMQPKPDPPII